MMKRFFLCVMAFALLLTASARHQVLQPSVKTLQVVVNQEWTAPLAVMQLHSDDVLHVAFDELSHNYHRYVMHIERCEADWSTSDGLFESDWLEGFNNQVIDDYENSINTTVLFTHYRYQLPNDQCRLKMSGNYRLHVVDDDNDQEEVAVIELRVVEPLMNVGLGITTNTDLGLNTSYQQASMTVNYNGLRVTNQDEQIQTFVMQNGRDDNMKVNVRPNFVMPTGLQWEHARQLIFDGGNEYHKFEVLDPTHTTMGLDRVRWDQQERRYHVYPFVCEPQRNYLYDEDADGAFYIRNSENFENDRTSDYVYVHYKLMPARHYDNAQLVVEGQWTNGPQDDFVMTYDEADHSYNATVLQKMGYYNYQLLMVGADGVTHRVPEEGSFFQTENRYEALVYYKGTGERSWRLVGYQEIVYK